MQRLLPDGCSYHGIDRASKKRTTPVCDLNSGDFPTEAASQCDVIVMLGALERIADVENLFTHLRFCKRDIILSYCATDLAKDLDRTALGFANHLSFYDLALLFDRYGFRIECTTPIDETQVLMRLTPTEWLAPATSCSVAVISDDGGGNFAARLGCHMVNSLLPGEAEVHHLTFHTLNEARANYDLVILGVGSGLFPPLLGEEVLDVVSRSRAAIGIFGTQRRELISRPTVDRMIERLDTWFARYEDDVLMYGRGRNNVVHIGDWLIDQFPLTRAINDEPLVISNETRRGARAGPRHSYHPATQAGLLDSADGAALRSDFGGACGLCRNAGAATRSRGRPISQHVDRYFWPRLSGTKILPGRPGRRDPLQGACPLQCGESRRAHRIDSAQRCGRGSLTSTIIPGARRRRGNNRACIFIFPRRQPI